METVQATVLKRTLVSILPILNALVAVSKGTRAAKLLHQSAG